MYFQSSMLDVVNQKLCSCQLIVPPHIPSCQQLVSNALSNQLMLFHSYEFFSSKLFLGVNTPTPPRSRRLCCNQTHTDRIPIFRLKFQYQNFNSSRNFPNPIFCCCFIDTRLLNIKHLLSGSNIILQTFTSRLQYSQAHLM